MHDHAVASSDFWSLPLRRAGLLAFLHVEGARAPLTGRRIRSGARGYDFKIGVILTGMSGLKKWGTETVLDESIVITPDL